MGTHSAFRPGQRGWQALRQNKSPVSNEFPKLSYLDKLRQVNGCYVRESCMAPEDLSPYASPQYSTPQPQQVAPMPGTYYENAAGQALNQKKSLGKALKAFMVMQWLVFGFGIFGILSALPRLTSPRNEALLTAVSIFLQIGAVTLAFLCAYGITKYKKWAAKTAWISIGYGWFNLVAGAVLSVFSYQYAQDKLLSDPNIQDSGLNGIATTITIVALIISFVFSAAWILTETLLFRSKSARESISMYFE